MFALNLDSFSASILFGDDVRIGEISDDAITVTGPNGFETTATVISSFEISGSLVSVDYAFDTSLLGPEDTGDFAVFVNEDSVFDEALNATPAGELGRVFLSFA